MTGHDEHPNDLCCMTLNVMMRPEPFRTCAWQQKEAGCSKLVYIYIFHNFQSDTSQEKIQIIIGNLYNRSVYI